MGIIAYLLLATFPGIYLPIEPGLDPSWQLGINLLPHMPQTFGHDVVFTYGPLGFLLVPRDVGGNLLWAIAGWLVIHGLLGAVLVHNARRGRSVLGLIAFAALFLTAQSFGLFYEDRLLIVTLLLLTIPPEEGLAWRLAAAAAAVLAVVLLFVKLTVGIPALVAVGLVAMSWLPEARAGWRGVAVCMAAPGAAMLLLGAFLLFDGPAGMVAWLRFAFEISTGFGEAMSVPEEAGLSFLGVGALAVIVGTAAWVGLRDRMLGLAAAAAAVAFFAFRHSYVRHHGRFIFSVAIVLAGVLALAALSRRARLVAVVGAIPLVVIAGIGSAHEACICPWSARHLGLGPGWERAGQLASLGETRAELAAFSAERLSLVKLPAGWVDRLRIAGRGTDAVPYEISFLEANGLDWTPNPVLQTYLAYTAALDERVAEHFSGAEGPDYLLAQFTEIDGRHPLLASPRTWDAILRHYHLASEGRASGPYGDVFLLARRAEPAPGAERHLSSAVIGFDEWVDVPEGAARLGLGFDRALAGRLAALVWRIEAVMLDLAYEDGSVSTVRILPATSEGGLIVHAPRNKDEFEAMLERTSPFRVSRIRVHGPGEASFDERIQVTWLGD